MQAGGRRFDPVILHHPPEVSGQACRVACYPAGLTPYRVVLFNKLEEGCIAEVPEDRGVGDTVVIASNPLATGGSTESCL